MTSPLLIGEKSKMGDDLPTDYDVIVLGSGMSECILAAALSRIGKTVLHIDRNDYYSGDWATFNFEGLQKWAVKHSGTTSESKLKPKEVELSSLLKDGETVVDAQINSNTISNVNQKYFISEKPAFDPETSIPKPDDQKENNYPDAQPSCENTDEDSGKNDTKPNDSDQTVPTYDAPCNEETNTDKLSMDSTEDQNKDTNDSVKQDVNDKISDDAVKGDKDANVEQTKSKVKEIQESSEQCSKEKGKVVWTVEGFKKQWRKFNLDLAPKILFSRGAMVELLISSDIAKYCEFKTVTRVLTHMDGNIKMTPCSRADVFANKEISMIEKRMMMKFLTFCMEYEKHPSEYEGHEGKTFAEFLSIKKLSPNLQHYILNAISMATKQTPLKEGLSKTQKFLQSLGRYGNTAFLWPLYGSGEIPQCFCRMCAVFGGIYCLRMAAQSVILDSNCSHCTGIINTEGTRLNCDWLVMEQSYTPQSFLPDSYSLSQISRGILITDSSILPSAGDQISLLHLPPSEQHPHPITVLELSPTSMACPEGLHVVHMTSRSSKSASEDLAYAVDLIFTGNQASRERPNILWSLFFNQIERGDNASSDVTPENLLLVSGPNSDMDYEQSVLQARELFEKVCPGEEFCPKAPNPEDIIFDFGENKEGTTESGFEPPKEGFEIKDGDTKVSNDAVEESVAVGNDSEKTEDQTINDSTNVTNATTDKPDYETTTES
ncbi:unnamed protein product [Owenia fusiformis]|uniref:Uncharacterized protein n=1 Tax=Owenia fusiformis TaxID=6347 RepID=A0A8J1THG5_OWEFU|nr:unnamed protein product [Owenia fusiformis]